MPVGDAGSEPRTSQAAASQKSETGLGEPRSKVTVEADKLNEAERAETKRSYEGIVCLASCMRVPSVIIKTTR